MDLTLARMIDANANRAREALRVLEDYARFGLNDDLLCTDLKALRHGLAAALRLIHADAAMLSRDTPGDVGTHVKTAAEFQRAGMADVVTAAGKRLSEALRVLEEAAKTSSQAAAADMERIRYKGYSIEQILTRAVRQTDRFANVRLYVLLTEALCARPWEETLDAVLAGGATCVQLREKALPDGELLRRARVLVQKCRTAGAISIINDRPDMALLAGVDGVHVGQGDLPAAEIRRLVGHDLIVGVSTGFLDEARQAVRDGATYIGVGPMFPTTTKDKPRLAGPAFAAEALVAVRVPCVAIGGITPTNIAQLTAVGVRSVAVCAAIIQDSDPAARCAELAKKLPA
jgi:thiamine-phosphate pyrophosphorylase